MGIFVTYDILVVSIFIYFNMLASYQSYRGKFPGKGGVKASKM